MGDPKPQAPAIEGIEYNADKLFANVRAKIMRVRVTDQEIEHLKQRLAIAIAVQLLEVFYRLFLAATGLTLRGGVPFVIFI